MQMKINFDELFNIPQSEQKSLFKNKSHISRASTSLGYEEVTKFPPQEAPVLNKKQQKIEGQDSKERKYNETMRILQFNKPSGESYYWYNESKFDDQPSSKVLQQIPKNKFKSFNKKQAQKLTNRLAQTHKCSRNCCKKACQQGLLKKIDQTIKERNLPLLPKKRHHRTFTEMDKNLTKNPRYIKQLHERLYQEYKTKQFYNMELSLSYSQKYKQQNKMKTYEQNPQYTQNYVGFYNRLESQIERRQKREQFYKSTVVDGGRIVQFAPNISSSQKSLKLSSSKPSIIPRKQGKQLKGRGQMNIHQRLCSSLDSIDRSFQSSLNKTTEIVQKKQQHFLNKMLTLFQEDGYFRLKAQAIQELKQIQFQILFPLISKMQKQEHIPIQVFEAKLRKYFQGLPSFSKIQLRNCYRDRARHRLKIRQTQTINISTTEKESESMKSKRSKPNEKGKGDYLQKINMFV